MSIRGRLSAATVLPLMLAASLALMASPGLTAAAQAISCGGFEEPPPGSSRLVGAPQATCTVKTCRYKFTCAAGTDPEDLCAFKAALVTRGALVTGPTFNCVDPETGERFYPWPEAKGTFLSPGQSKVLKLQTIPPGRQAIKRALKKGERRLKAGGWEAVRSNEFGPPPDFNLITEDGPVTIKLKRP